jgi:hypothetical protein
MKSLCKVDSTWPQWCANSHACYSCHHPSAALTLYNQTTYKDIVRWAL